MDRAKSVRVGGGGEGRKPYVFSYHWPVEGTTMSLHPVSDEIVPEKTKSAEPELKHQRCVLPKCQEHIQALRSELAKNSILVERSFEEVNQRELKIEAQRRRILQLQANIVHLRGVLSRALKSLQ